MAYLDTKRRPDAGSMAAAVAIPAAIGAALVLGLTVTGTITVKPPNVTTFEPRETPPPPPEPPKPDTSPAAAKDPVIFVPNPPTPFPTREPEFATSDTLPPPGSRPTPGPSILPDVIPTATPSFAPVGARPRSDPGSWVTTDDYRSNWIRQEMTGKARFRLEIAADGRVTNCTITGSSGHSQLDAATCALVSKRAKFQPARGSEGEPVAGSYSNAIDWQLPN